MENEADYHISYSLAKRLPSATAAGTNPRCSSGAVCEPNNIPSWLDWVTNLRNQNDGAGRYYPDLAYKIGDPQNASYGGYGTFETTRKSLDAKQDYLFPDLEWGNTKHTIAFGWSAEWAQARYKRFNDVYNYTGSSARSTSGIACLAGDHGCIEGQFFTTRDYYPARSVKVGNNHYALYFEDKINWGNWEITPGIRIDHDRFLKYTDFAPRFTATWDVFGNGDTRLFGGINRYYAQSVLAQKLKKNIGSGYRQSRSLPNQEWGSTTRYAAAYLQPDVKTPYSDEVNLGWRQVIKNTEWTLKWVHRDSKKGLAWDSQRINGQQYFILNNRGKSKADTFSLAFNLLRPWKITDWAVVGISGGATYSRNKANNSSYDNTSVNSLDNGRLTEESSKIIFDGKLMDKDKMPAIDYNTPWRAFANISVDFPKIKLNWSTRLNYAAGYAQYTTSSERCPAYNPDICGSYTGSVGVYEKEKFKNAFTVDFGLIQTIPIGKNKLDLKLDVINAFDTVIRARTSRASTSTSNTVSYKLGRQFWFEAKYSW